MTISVASLVASGSLALRERRGCRWWRGFRPTQSARWWSAAIASGRAFVLRVIPGLILVVQAAGLRSAVLGANDGIVSTAGPIVGVAAAAQSDVPIAGVAGLVAGAMSMGGRRSPTLKADPARERVRKTPSNNTGAVEHLAFDVAGKPEALIADLSTKEFNIRPRPLPGACTRCSVAIPMASRSSSISNRSEKTRALRNRPTTCRRRCETIYPRTRRILPRDVQFAASCSTATS